MKRVIIAITALSLLGGCGIIQNARRTPTTPTVGQRIPVLTGETSTQVDPGLADVAIALPLADLNQAWAQPGGNAEKSMGHLALNPAPGPAWTVRIGSGSSNRGRLAAEPIVAQGMVYTIDTQAVVRAFTPENGGVVWQTQVRGPNDSSATLFGGGISFDNGRIYATNGSGHAAALDAGTGAVLWLARPGGPLRGAPTISNDTVYVVSQDNQLYALEPHNGVIRWSAAGAVEAAGLFGSASPAAARGTVIAGYSSGELTAYRYENGRILWQDALTRTSIATTVGTLSDINADPVIHEGVVYAIGKGGRMVALELVTGQRLWEINAAGISRPWVAGDWIFVVTDEAQLLAVQRATGRVKWMTQLTRYRNAEKRTGPISWTGPVLAGDRLIVANTLGQLVNVSPFDGTVYSTVDTRLPISLPPVAAGGTLYVLHDNGQMSAWR
jgi:outer membrane protein assembly factor BamB